MIASTFLLASWFGCIIVATIGMLLGRRTWIIIGNLIQILGTIISASSFSYGQLIAGRVFIVSNARFQLKGQQVADKSLIRALVMDFSHQ